MREHIEHSLAAGGVLVLALFVSYFHTPGPAPSPVPSEPAATSSPTLATVSSSSSPGFIISTSTFTKIFPAPPTPVPTKAPPKTAVTPTAPAKPATPAPAPVETPPAATPPASTTDTSPLLSTLSKSVVNILCTAKDGSLRSTSGSGVIIDSRGIILTVAHVAQSALLQEYLGSGKVSCVARIGSPAKSAYLVRPIYVSSLWLHKNATTLISSQPTGTGQNDVALLAITGSATGAALPSSYPAVSISSDTASIGDKVGIGSYGAQYLTSEQIRSSLYPTLVTSSVADRYTFTSFTVDVLSISGSKASQEGSSGGAVVNAKGGLIGIITTSENSGDFSNRTLRAITPLHISRSFKDDTGGSFDSYVNGKSVSELVSSYAPQAQTLGHFLASSIGLAQ